MFQSTVASPTKSSSCSIHWRDQSVHRCASSLLTTLRSFWMVSPPECNYSDSAESINLREEKLFHTPTLSNVMLTSRWFSSSNNSDLSNSCCGWDKNVTVTLPGPTSKPPRHGFSSVVVILAPKTTRCWKGIFLGKCTRTGPALPNHFLHSNQTHRWVWVVLCHSE